MVYKQIDHHGYKYFKVFKDVHKYKIINYYGNLLELKLINNQILIIIKLLVDGIFHMQKYIILNLCVEKIYH